VLAVRSEKTMMIGNDNVHKNIGINNSPLRIIIIIIIIIFIIIPCTQSLIHRCRGLQELG